MKHLIRVVCLFLLLVGAFSPIAGDQNAAAKPFLLDENEDAANAKMREAIRLYNKGKFDEAVAKATEALALDDRNGAAMDVRAASYLALEEYELAIKDYNQVIKLAPREPKAWNNRAYTRLTIGMVKGALEDYERAVALKADYAWAISGRANCKSMLGDKKGALADCDRVLELEPDFAGIHASRADIYRSMGDYKSAQVEAELELKADPKNLNALWVRGECYRYAKDWAKARADFEAVQTGNPAWVPSYVSLAAVFIGLGEKAKAAEYLASALDLALKDNQLTPNHPTAAYEVACIYCQRSLMRETPELAAKDIDLAVRNLNRAVKLGFIDWSLLKMDPDLVKARDDERIKKILAGK